MIEIISERIRTIDIKFLIEYCDNIPELYNKVANRLHDDFQIESAEIFLLCTYMVNSFLKEYVITDAKIRNYKGDLNNE